MKGQLQHIELQAKHDKITRQEEINKLREELKEKGEYIELQKRVLNDYSNFRRGSESV